VRFRAGTALLKVPPVGRVAAISVSLGRDTFTPVQLLTAEEFIKVRKANPGAHGRPMMAALEGDDLFLFPGAERDGDLSFTFYPPPVTL